MVLTDAYSALKKQWHRGWLGQSYGGNSKANKANIDSSPNLPYMS